MWKTLYEVPCGRLNCAGDTCNQCRVYWLADGEEQSTAASRDHIPLKRVFFPIK